jgi:hypothetical protein
MPIPEDGRGTAEAFTDAKITKKLSKVTSSLLLIDINHKPF